METAIRPVSYTLLFCGTKYSSNNLYYQVPTKYLCTNSLPSSLALTLPRNYAFNFGSKHKEKLRFNGFVSSSSSTSERSPSQQLAVLLEVEGVLMDVYRLGNRQAFNVAFRKLGLDCANWSEPVYLDLLRKSVGDEERMLILYFDRIGWPTSVPTSEKGAFMKSVLREKKNALEDLVMSKAFPLRPGVEEFIDEASKEGVPVVFLTAYSTSGEKLARSIVDKLGEDKISKTKVIGDKEVKESFYGQLVFGKGVSSSMDEQLANAVAKAASAERQRIAEEVASVLKLKVELNTNSNERMKNIIATLRAGAEYADVPVHSCVLIAGSQSGVAAAERIGMPCVVLRSSIPNPVQAALVQGADVARFERYFNNLIGSDCAKATTYTRSGGNSLHKIM